MTGFRCPHPGCTVTSLRIDDAARHGRDCHGWPALTVNARAVRITYDPATGVTTTTEEC